MKLWLDDIRPAPAGYVWVKSTREAIDQLQDWTHYNGVCPCELFCMDHDLGPSHYFGDDDGQTGYAVVLWMERFNCWPHQIIVHSWNPEGSRRMVELASKYTNASYKRYNPEDWK